MVCRDKENCTMKSTDNWHLSPCTVTMVKPRRIWEGLVACMENHVLVGG
jgi:hypothetical protein